jgi:hypothetical protein
MICVFSRHAGIREGTNPRKQVASDVAVQHGDVVRAGRESLKTNLLAEFFYDRSSAYRNFEDAVAAT